MKADEKKHKQYRVTWRYNRTRELQIGAFRTFRFAPNETLTMNEADVAHRDFARVADDFVVQEVK